MKLTAVVQTNWLKTEKSSDTRLPAVFLGLKGGGGKANEPKKHSVRKKEK